MSGEMRDSLAPMRESAMGQANAEVAMRMFAKTKQMMGTMVEYRELMMMYACAMKQVRTKFEVLNTEFTVRYRRNPISSINTRLKKTASIIDKLNRKEKAFCVKDIEGSLYDVAGVRVICSYIDDIYQIAEALLRQDDVTLIQKKDYIQTPKPNSYRSLHLIIKVPVYFAETKRDMAVEVQIRTIAMDFWASLEHQLKYKQEIPDQQAVIAQLKACADVITNTDENMLALRSRIEAMEDAATPDEIMLEKLGRLDIAID